MTKYSVLDCRHGTAKSYTLEVRLSMLVWTDVYSGKRIEQWQLVRKPSCLPDQKEDVLMTHYDRATVEAAALAQVQRLRDNSCVVEEVK